MQHVPNILVHHPIASICGHLVNLSATLVILLHCMRWHTCGSKQHTTPHRVKILNSIPHHQFPPKLGDPFATPVTLFRGGTRLQHTAPTCGYMSYTTHQPSQRVGATHITIFGVARGSKGNLFLAFHLSASYICSNIHLLRDAASPPHQSSRTLAYTQSRELHVRNWTNPRAGIVVR